MVIPSWQHSDCTSDSKPKSLELMSTIEFSHFWTWYIGGISGHLHDGPKKEREISSAQTPDTEGLDDGFHCCLQSASSCPSGCLGLGWFSSSLDEVSSPGDLLDYGIAKVAKPGTFFDSSWKKAGTCLSCRHCRLEYVLQSYRYHFFPVRSTCKFDKTALRMDAIGLGRQEAVQKLRDVGM